MPEPETCTAARVSFRAGLSAAAGVMAGESPVDLGGPGLEFLDFREYSYGDDIRHVDWRVSARLGRGLEKLFTRVYRAERKAEVVWLVDLSGSMGYLWKPRAEALLLGIAAAVSERLGDTVYLVTYSHRVRSYRPSKPLAAAYLALKDICTYGYGGSLGPGDAATAAARVAHARPVILFSDYAARLRSYRRAARLVSAASGWLAAFLAVTPGELGLSPPGVVYLGSPEGGGGIADLGEFSVRVRRHVNSVREVFGMGRVFEVRSPEARLARRTVVAYSRWRARMPVEAAWHAGVL